jgi:hypothetical protein
MGELKYLSGGQNNLPSDTRENVHSQVLLTALKTSKSYLKFCWFNKHSTWIPEVYSLFKEIAAISKVVKCPCHLLQCPRSFYFEVGNSIPSTVIACLLSHSEIYMYSKYNV